MYTIKSVEAKENFILSALFVNGITKEYDIKPLFNIFSTFIEFKTNPGLFEQVKVDTGGYGIYWNDDLYLDANDIWEDGIEVGKEEVDIVDMLISELIKAREMVGMTQKQLSEATGIYQSDISKIERGLANPSLFTLKRLADEIAEACNLRFDLDYYKEDGGTRFTFSEKK